jgi:hypothetical protein
VKKAHIALMKHPETALYSGVMLMGKSEVVDEGCPTAYTDGVNKVYGRKFLETVDTEPKVRGLVLHENLHVALKQLPRGKDMFDENRKLANIAADLVVNNIIEDIKGTVNGSSERIVALPDGAVYDPMFQNWSMREIYNYLKKNCKGGKKGKGGQQGGQGNEPPSGGSGDSDDDDDLPGLIDLIPDGGGWAPPAQITVIVRATDRNGNVIGEVNVAEGNEYANTRLVCETLAPLAANRVHEPSTPERVIMLELKRRFSQRYNTDARLWVPHMQFMFTSSQYLTAEQQRLCEEAGLFEPHMPGLPVASARTTLATRVSTPVRLSRAREDFLRRFPPPAGIQNEDWEAARAHLNRLSSTSYINSNGYVANLLSEDGITRINLPDYVQEIFDAISIEHFESTYEIATLADITSRFGIELSPVDPSDESIPGPWGRAPTHTSEVGNDIQAEINVDNNELHTNDVEMLVEDSLNSHANNTGVVERAVAQARDIELQAAAARVDVEEACGKQVKRGDLSEAERIAINAASFAGTSFTFEQYRDLEPWIYYEHSMESYTAQPRRHLSNMMLMSDLRFLNSREAEDNDFSQWLEYAIQRRRLNLPIDFEHQPVPVIENDILVPPEQAGPAQDESDNDSTVLDDVKNHLN